MAPLPPPSPLPDFVYKITPNAPPDPIAEQYPLSELDRQDGFVHLSASWQACLPYPPTPYSTQPSIPNPKPIQNDITAPSVPCTNIATPPPPNKQVPITADLFFADAPSFYLVKLRLANFGPSSVKWDEVDGTNGCPHLYGNFGGRDVVAVKEFRRGEGQSWREVFEGEEENGWLE